MIKLMEIEPILEILNPILAGKCKGLFAYELVQLVEELETQLEKVNKVKEKMINDYAIKEQDGKYKVIKVDDDREIYDFAENAEKVEEELQAVMNEDYEIDNMLSFDYFKEIDIEPIKLKILMDRKIITK